MHIMECYVENFGKLHQYTYEADRGLNVICEGNGSGKTTLAAFIRAMFYGMPATRTKKTLDDAERRKYKPWQGGMWGGNLSFFANGKEYRIERTFSDRDSQDTFRLLDRNTGLVSEDYTKNIGNELFGIDRAGFTSSIYIANNDLRVSLNDSLSARIGDSPIEEDDLNHYEKAMDLLNADYKKYGRNGKPHVMQELEEVRCQYRQKKEKYDALAMVTQPPAMDSYPQWKLTAEQLERLEQLDDFFSVGLPTGTQLEQCQRLLTECGQLEKRLDKGAAGTFGYNKEHSGNGIIIYKYLAGVLFCCSVIFLLLSQTQSGNAFFQWLGGMGFAAAGIAFLMGIRSKRGVGKRAKADAYHKDGTNEAAVNRREQEEITGTIKKKLTQVERFLDTFELGDTQNSLTQSELMEEYHAQLAQLDKLRMEYAFLSEKDSDYRNAVLELRQKEQQHRKDTYLRERQKLGVEIYDLEVKAQRLKQQCDIAEQRMKLIDTTKEMLEQAHDEIMAGYLYGIRQYFEKYISMFDSQLAERLSLDVGFHVGIEEGGILRQLDYYSQGYKDVIRLCQRLALTESLFQKEKPFIILDDPFINLDDEMLGRAKNALEMLSAHMQIIYFTCSWTREPEEENCK